MVNPAGLPRTAQRGCELETDRESEDRQTESQTSRQTESQKTDRQRDRQTDRQRERHLCALLLAYCRAGTECTEGEGGPHSVRPELWIDARLVLLLLLL